MLGAAILATADNQALRNSLIDELNTKYPEVLKNLNKEILFNIVLEERLEEVNKQLINKIILQKKDEELDKAREKAADLFDEQSEATKGLTDIVLKLSKARGVEIDNEKTLIQQAKELSTGRGVLVGLMGKFTRAEKRFSEAQEESIKLFTERINLQLELFGIDTSAADSAAKSADSAAKAAEVAATAAKAAEEEKAKSKAEARAKELAEANAANKKLHDEFLEFLSNNKEALISDVQGTLDEHDELIERRKEQEAEIQASIKEGRDIQSAEEDEELEKENARFDKMIENEQRLADAKAELRATELDSAIQFTSAIAGLAKKGSKLQTALFVFEKGLAIARIATNLQIELGLIAVTSGGLAPLILTRSIGAKIRAATGVATILATAIPQFLSKGTISIDGKGTATSDSIPAMLSRGESVMTAGETMKHKDALLAIRGDYMDRYINQNYVIPMLQKQSQGSNNVGGAMFDDFGIIRQLKKTGTVNIKNGNMLAKQIGREVSNNNYFNDRY